LVFCDLLSVNEGSIAWSEILNSDFMSFEGDFEVGSADWLGVDENTILGFGVSAQDDFLFLERMGRFLLSFFVEHLYDH
jgi:hypothetical protein